MNFGKSGKETGRAIFCLKYSERENAPSLHGVNPTPREVERHLRLAALCLEFRVEQNRLLSQSR
jgi:hypothetical protein